MMHTQRNITTLSLLFVIALAVFAALYAYALATGMTAPGAMFRLLLMAWAG